MIQGRSISDLGVVARCRIPTPSIAATAHSHAYQDDASYLIAKIARRRPALLNVSNILGRTHPQSPQEMIKV